MDWLQKIENDPVLAQTLSRFLAAYGLSGLSHAMRDYISMQQEYICKTKTEISKIKIIDINYLTIHTHTIHIYTPHGVYQKYGSLNNEYKILSGYGFLRCNQSTLVAIRKIRTIRKNTILLTDNTVLHLSRNCAPKILMEFSLRSID